MPAPPPARRRTLYPPPALHGEPDEPTTLVDLVELARAREEAWTDARALPSTVPPPGRMSRVRTPTRLLYPPEEAYPSPLPGLDVEVEEPDEEPPSLAELVAARTGRPDAPEFLPYLSLASPEASRSSPCSAVAQEQAASSPGRGAWRPRAVGALRWGLLLGLAFLAIVGPAWALAWVLGRVAGAP